MQTPLSILQQYWQHTAFRGRQEAIIQAVLDGKDTLALLPTGGGKSVCYQIPALLKEGLCLVISPLIALMKDQLNNLEKKGIPSLAIHSGMTQYEAKQTLQKAAYGNYKFLYVSPERLETRLFKEYLPALNINLLAVDEAHCISQWGYDFRPSYLRIIHLKNNLSCSVPVLALTASATPVVQQDIIDKLQLDNPAVFRQPFTRPNISYSVFKVDSKLNKLLEILQNVQGSGIVYCKTRRQTKDIAKLLSQHSMTANCYHAGLSGEERNVRQQAWIDNKLRVMVCTNAFGMGIDKPDVRTVIHFDVPDCLENYYQEAGRAGRDGKRAFAVLLYHSKDESELKAFPLLRFPTIDAIKNVYQHLCDFLEIPVGIGEDNYYNFDLKTFVTNFKLDIHLVINSIKALEQEGYFTFNESIFLPAQIGFTADRFLLDEFQQSHPQYEPIIKCLLRTYEGIYDNRVSVSEKQIARLTGVKETAARQQLQQLQAFGILEYLQQKETPQIHFLHNRASAKYLIINYESYAQRKQEYTCRVEQMLQYLHLENTCRSTFISKYFGDNESTHCAVCDNCIAQRSLHISKEEFDKITTHILHLIPSHGIDIKQLKSASACFNRSKFWKVLNYLQQERKIKSINGIVQLA
ncbi:RecQ family ATP-dependent DNA helicase [Ilyomonas limi]|uniref:ATP-dependent DNA helicase RecQ n=1 Tax=Ilyomonas limi TaxID=2575867 RepID=A0A4U3L577_9BACT|nr:ATP-dependent DNA helicase RecQ [Ilyomonas limi]TKK68836.1 RecQ family ATP-dependent DNA helicase [Ilyomonas limi]